jgi:subtilisin family serine protease
MAVRSSRRVATAGGRDQAMHTSTQSAHVPGQLIIRFKTSAVQHVAAQSVSRRARTLAAAVPDEIAGPLSMLKERAGMRALKPLFVPAGEGPKPQPNVMAAAGIHRALARSATDAARPALTGYQLVELKGKKVSPALLKKLRASKAVDFVEPVPNRWLSAADPLVNRQWGLRAIRWFDGQHPDAAAVHVAVLDSGVDEGHPDLKDAIEQYRHDGTKARDFLGHGTHVSGTIAAIVNNSVGVAGVANCRLHCWKVFEDPPAGSDDPDFNFEFYSTALASALDTDIKVINLSIGGTERSRAEAAVFAELRAAGVIAVAAMGNEFKDGNPKEFPAGYPGPLAVGAVDETDRRASFSNTGAHIGIVAPGVSILSTVPRVKALLADKTDYDSWPGTSMATPHVAGAAALLYASRTRSKEAADDIVKRLTSTAKKVAAMKKKAFTKEYGAGLLNVAAALKGA